MRGSLNVILMLFLFRVVCVSPFCLLMLHFQYLGGTNYLILRSPMFCRLVYAKVFHTPLQYLRFLSSLNIIYILPLLWISFFVK